jgi:hypothetical protein
MGVTYKRKYKNSVLDSINTQHQEPERERNRFRGRLKKRVIKRRKEKKKKSKVVRKPLQSRPKLKNTNNNTLILYNGYQSKHVNYKFYINSQKKVNIYKLENGYILSDVLIETAFPDPHNKYILSTTSGLEILTFEMYTTRIFLKPMYTSGKSEYICLQKLTNTPRKGPLNLSFIIKCKN